MLEVLRVLAQRAQPIPNCIEALEGDGGIPLGLGGLHHGEVALLSDGLQVILEPRDDGIEVLGDALPVRDVAGPAAVEERLHDGPVDLRWPLPDRSGQDETCDPRRRHLRPVGQQLRRDHAVAPRFRLRRVDPREVDPGIPAVDRHRLAVEGGDETGFRLGEEHAHVGTAGEAPRRLLHPLAVAGRSDGGISREDHHGNRPLGRTQPGDQLIHGGRTDQRRPRTELRAIGHPPLEQHRHDCRRLVLLGQVERVVRHPLDVDPDRAGAVVRDPVHRGRAALLPARGRTLLADPDPEGVDPGVGVLDPGHHHLHALVTCRTLAGHLEVWPRAPQPTLHDVPSGGQQIGPLIGPHGAVDDRHDRSAPRRATWSRSTLSARALAHRSPHPTLRVISLALGTVPLDRDRASRPKRRRRGDPRCPSGTTGADRHAPLPDPRRRPRPVRWMR